MRATVAAFLVLLPALVAAAQSATDTQSPHTATSLPPIGLPLPATGLPLPPVGLAPAGPTPTESPRSTSRPAPHGAVGRRPHVESPAVIYAVPAGTYGWSTTPGAQLPGTIAPASSPRVASELEPADPPASPGAPVAALPAPSPAAENLQAAAPPIVRKPLYYVPGCYLGDVPPRDAGLPASCDLRLTVTYRP